MDWVDLLASWGRVESHLAGRHTVDSFHCIDFTSLGPACGYRVRPPAWPHRASVRHMIHICDPETSNAVALLARDPYRSSFLVPGNKAGVVHFDDGAVGRRVYIGKPLGCALRCRDEDDVSVHFVIVVVVKVPSIEEGSTGVFVNCSVSCCMSSRCQEEGSENVKLAEVHGGQKRNKGACQLRRLGMTYVFIQISNR